MKKLFYLLVILYAFYLSIQLGFRYFGSGHQNNYYIESSDVSWLVNETYVSNQADEHDNYYLIFSKDNVTFNFQTYYDFNGASEIVTDLKYYEDDDYKCLLPVFKNGLIIFDFLCISDETITYYYNIEGQDNKLDTYVSNLDLASYNTDKWTDNNDNVAEVDTVKVYTDNIINNHYASVSNYKGVYTINDANFKKIYSVEFFDSDVYERKISTFVNNYYLTADYEEKYNFSTFYLVNIVNNKVSKIVANYSISFDSYIQGIVDDSVYLYDRTNKKQYQIKTKSSYVMEIGNASSGVQIYNNGSWETINITAISKEDIYFNTDIDSNNNYVRIDKVGNVQSGYIYYYQKVGSSYKVYRSDIVDSSQKVYLYTTNAIDNIKYLDDYVYYIDGNELKYYNDMTGVRTLLINTEFTFNDNIIFDVYSKN
ncbi:MAG: hypothetical protein PHE54_04935 [Bacilli bacterium]|nr:hypothetical protein [Bacilli bacterium]